MPRILYEVFLSYGEDSTVEEVNNSKIKILELLEEWGVMLDTVEGQT